jgi:uncharacterized damage-inducible protein DinB
MNIDVIRMLYDYNYRAHRRVWDECIMALTDDQFKQPVPYSIGSLHQQVVHTISAEWIWFSRLCGISPTAMLQADDYPTRDIIREKWDSVEAVVRDYLGATSDAHLEETFDYQQTNGVLRQDKRLDILLHVINHGTDHRAQMLRILHDFGAPTIEQDIIFYLREARGEK